MIIKAYKNGTEFDLELLGSRGYKYDGIEVDYKCNICGNVKKVKYASLLRRRSVDRQICLACSIDLILEKTF